LKIILDKSKISKIINIEGLKYNEPRPGIPRSQVIILIEKEDGTKKQIAHH